MAEDKVYERQNYLSFLFRTGINFTDRSATVFKLEYKKPSGSIGAWTATTTATAIIDGVTTTIDSASGAVVYQISSTSQLDEDGLWKFQPYVRFADGSHARGKTVSVYVYDRFK